MLDLSEKTGKPHVILAFDILVGLIRAEPVATVARTLLVVDNPGSLSHDEDEVIACWSTFHTPEAAFSIPALVERTSLEIKAEYLAWVHDLGETPIDGRTLKELLVLDEAGLSAWWLSVIAEKSPLKSTTIYEIFKLRALERLYVELGCTGLVYRGRDRRIERALRAWCRDLHHSYHWSRTASGTHRRTMPVVQRVIRVLPHFAQAAAFLFWKLLTRYIPTWLRRSPATDRGGNDQRALIVTYFPNIDLELARLGHFRSSYWGPLHDLLDHLRVAPDWIWIHGNTEQCDFRQALCWRRRFNAHASHGSRHFVLEDFATPRALLHAIWSYARLYVRGLALEPLRPNFVLPGSTLNFFPICERDWRSSLFGTAAISGVLSAALFEALMGRIPGQRCCLYLWESQPWESALIAAWRRHRAGPIIGYQHATVMPLDLAAFRDARTYRDAGRGAYPLPDVLAVNGRGTLNLLHEAQYPEDGLALVEALRYPRLTRSTRRGVERRKTLLVIGGYLESEATMVLRVLDEASDAVRGAGFTRILIKGHPFGPAQMRSLNLPLKLAYDIVSDPLDTLLNDSDFALVANSTSGAVEALYAGIPIAICKSEDNLNLSPLFGHPAVPFVANGAEFAAALATPRCALLPVDYFLISDKPRRWRDLLSWASHAAPVTARGS